jgi:signal transduction histidine kinase
MRRPWHVWFVFGLSVAAMIPALMWLSFRTMALEKEQKLARAIAAQQENIESVLLRLDSQVAPLLLRETSRPYYDYEPTHIQSMRNVILGKNEDMALAIASPLVLEAQPEVLLHFEVFADGEKCSPEAVADDINCNQETKIPLEQIMEFRQRFTMIAKSIDYDSLAKRLSHTPPVNEALIIQNYAWQDKVNNLESQRQQRNSQDGYEAQSGNAPQQTAAPPNPAGGVSGAPYQSLSPSEEGLNRAAYNQESRSKLQLSKPMPTQGEQVAQLAMAPEEIVREGRWDAIWHENKLLLVRPVQRKSLQSIQVCWLDWASLQAKLTEEAQTLMPEAFLHPVNMREPDEKLSRMNLMAALPLELVVAQPIVHEEFFSPTIIMAWCGFVMAAMVVALLLSSVISLSERRAAFVTSVTHELRTPLTTFRMYAEMLSEGMVPDEVSRKRYLDTLRVEADRLGHLVENVLSYARLERGRGGKAREKVEIAVLLERTIARVAERAHQAGKEVELEIDKSLSQSTVSTDPGAVEQIVVNLIDNACKYARPASDSRVIVRLMRGPGGGVTVSVRDFGPGIRRGLFSGMFKPFSKTAQEAAISAPGVGLGLALCCRLAKQLGGRLVHHNAEGGGALMELQLN